MHVWLIVAGSHVVPEINHNNNDDDDYDWYFGSSCVLDGGTVPQPLYRGTSANQLTGTCSVDDGKTSSRCCPPPPPPPRRQNSAPAANSVVTDPCQYIPCLL